jgi:predicted dehydrogenase
MKPLRTAVVGIGGFATVHLRVIAEHEDEFRLEAAVVKLPYDERYDEQRREKALLDRGVRIYREHGEMFRAERDRIDLVTIPCGIPTHAEMSIAALESGFHVLCEKPAAGNYADALRMLDSRRRTGNLLMIGFQHLLRPSTQYIKKIARDGRFGRLESARTLISWPRDQAYYARNTWAGRISVDGTDVYDSPFQNACSHFFQNMLYVAGEGVDDCAEPADIYAENYRVHPIESADTQFVRVHTGSGVEIILVASHGSPETHEPTIEYVFEKGRIRWDISGRTEIFSTASDLDAVEVYCDPDGDFHDLPFLDAVRALRGAAPHSSIDNAVQHVRCVEAAFQSSGGITVIKPDCMKPDLYTSLRLAFDRRSSFQEMGFSWGVPGRRLTL